MANAKQDGVAPRTAADIEQKYNFGKSFAKVMGIAEDARDVAAEAKKAVGNLDSNLTAEEIFNRLTNNGVYQGLFKGEDGQVYINAEFISAIEKLFAKDITMSGKLTYTTEAYLPPTETEAEIIRNHLLGNITIPDELIPLYDVNGDGTISVSDLAGINVTRAGISPIENLSGIKKTPVTLTIDLTNPNKAIHIIGTNMWGSEVESYIGLDFGEKLNHYIVEQGEADGWVYEKWNNGIAKCWCRKAFTYTTTSPNFYATVDDAFTFPLGLFAETPIIQFTPFGAGLAKISGHARSAAKCSIYIQTAWAVTNSTVYIDTYCVGKWK